MRTAIFIAVFFLSTSIALFSQAPAKAPAKAPAAAPQNAAPAPKPPQAAAAPKPAASAAVPNAEFEKLKADQEKIRKATELAREWFRRLNALDGTPESINRFLEIHDPNAVYTSGPRGDDQMGPVFFQGRDMVQQFAAQMARNYSRIAYYIKQRTIENKTADLVTGTIGAWGDVSIAIEFAGSVNIKESGPAKEASSNSAKETGVAAREGANVKDASKERRFTVPGAAFFDIKDGKINRVRIMYAGGESFEVGGTWILGL